MLRGPVFGRVRELAAQFKRWWRQPWSRRELYLLVPCALLLLVTALVAERLRLSAYVMPGVVLGGHDVGGYSRRALDAELEAEQQSLSRRVVRVRVADAVFRFSGEEVGAQLPSGAADRALAAGRKGSWPAQLRWRFSRWFEPHRVELTPELDPASFAEQLAAMERAVLESPREGTLTFVNAKVERVDPRPGREIDDAAAKQRVVDALRADAKDVVELPVRERVPQTTVAAVDEVFARAKGLLASPLRLELAPLPPELAELEPSLREAGTEVVLSPKQLAAALEVRPRHDAPSRLELGLRADQVEALLEPARKRWERPSRDARFVVEVKQSIGIEPSALGSRVDLDALGRDLLSDAAATSHRVAVKLVPAEPPRITTELAQNLGIRGLVSQFVTYHPCCRPRVHNIHRIADLVTGSVVLPGELFSLNERVGPRSPASGFRSAPTIVHGEMKDTYGGGISQFTTTLFNAVLDGGYEIVERQAHTFYFDRYPVGHEATLSYPKPDFIFRNDTRYGVLLIAEYGPTYIRVKVYGDNEGRRTTRIVSPRFDFTEPKLEYLADPHVLPGESKVEEAGSRGFSVNVTRRITFADGRTSEQARKVTYDPRPRVVSVHPCDIPEGEEGHTGEPCPEPETVSLDGGVGQEVLEMP